MIDGPYRQADPNRCKTHPPWANSPRRPTFRSLSRPIPGHARTAREKGRTEIRDGIGDIRRRSRLQFHSIEIDLFLGNGHNRFQPHNDYLQSAAVIRKIIVPVVQLVFQLRTRSHDAFPVGVRCGIAARPWTKRFRASVICRPDAQIVLIEMQRFLADDDGVVVDIKIAAAELHRDALAGRTVAWKILPFLTGSASDGIIHGVDKRCPELRQIRDMKDTRTVRIQGIGRQAVAPIAHTALNLKKIFGS